MWKDIAYQRISQNASEYLPNEYLPENINGILVENASGIFTNVPEVTRSYQK